ncbi:elongation factor P [Candidatus Peregrinibacteria bacterium]|nr:elongation factor P [Candidatus Peregrinibacteria bacterium]
MAQSITDLKVGRLVNHNGEPFLIVSNSFMRTAQRKPVMRTKLRGVISGKVLDKTFIAGEDFDLVEIEKVRAQFMYKDADSAYFMDSITFDQFFIPLDALGDAAKYLKEGEDTTVTRYEGKPIGVELPVKVALKIVETTQGVRGDTATGGTKAATLETGLVVQVPLFLNEGDSVRINTETGEYVERA